MNKKLLETILFFLVLIFVLTGCIRGNDDMTIKKSDNAAGKIDLNEMLNNVQGKVYYVSLEGNDQNPGNEQLPFLTISKAAEIMVAGDACVVRGGVYRENIKPKYSGTKEKPILYVAYPGEEVTVSGADVITGEWTEYKNSIYVCNVDYIFNQIFCNGKMMIEARWPNVPDDNLVYMPRAKSGKGTNLFELHDKNLPAGNLNGAKVAIWAGGGWLSFSRSVSNYVPGEKFVYSVPFSKTSGNPEGFDPYEPQDENYYYLHGALDLLDSPNEWYLDTSEKKLYFFAPDGKSPKDHLLEVKKRMYAFNLSYRENIVLKGLKIFGAAVNMEGSNFCTIDSCHVKYVEHFTGSDGFAATNIYRANIMTGEFNEWKNSSIMYGAGNGIAVGGMSNKITNCIIRGVNYAGGYFANIYIDSGSIGTEIRNNTLSDSGRFLIYHCGAKKVMLTKNMLYNSSKLTNDCGATYAWTTDGEGSEISYNWVYNGDYAGIYLDNFCSNFKVHHNVVWNNKFAGIILNSDSLNNLIINNTIINNPGAFYTYTYPGNIPNQSGTRIVNNIIQGEVSFVEGDNAPELISNGNYLIDEKFIPENNSEAIDAGIVIDGINDSFVGTAPDIGAYENGGHYWKPGADWNNEK